MWKDYSKSYIKHNRASSVSIMAAASIAAMFTGDCDRFPGFNYPQFF